MCSSDLFPSHDKCDEFIIENPPIERIIAVPSEPEFLLDVGFRYTTVRPMPMFGTPGLVDHF